MPRIATDNKIVHGMWIGSQLSRLELLTLHSFTNFGHEFHLWAYDDLSSLDLPNGVRLRNAEDIIPRDKIFVKAKRDRELGIGRHSYGAISDLFRYRLLYLHGGIWADMDITCLRPFDFAGEYAFRPHRIGVVGSILKCPKRSKLLRKVFEEASMTVSAESAWLATNQILTRHVEADRLQRFIVKNMSNLDSWMEFVRPFIEEFTEIPDEWYAIHWNNETWRTLKADNGYFRGRQELGYVPDKDLPRPGSTLWELYRKYHLVDPWRGPIGSAPIRRKLGASAPALPMIARADQTRRPIHLNVLLLSAARGGAERIVLETMMALREVAGVTQNLYILRRTRQTYPMSGGQNLKITFLDDDADSLSAIRRFAFDILQTPSPILYTHLISASVLRVIWDLGISTIPVVHNTRQGWIDQPAVYGNPRVPFVVGVSEFVSAELRNSGCPKPVLTLRHELQRSYSAEELSNHRNEIRRRHGVDTGVLLIGMVGQFKAQKAYTRAVRVLHRVLQEVPAKLIILGGWDQDLGTARAAYEATCRQAVDLGVMADLILPGNIHPIDPYLAAFDVYLNTSVHEGLSISLLEAIQSGCPTVTADVGGNREILPKGSVIVEDGSDIEAYVRGIFEVARSRERVLPSRPGEPRLVPSLWAMLSKYGVVSPYPNSGSPSGTLFVTENLRNGGPQRSLANLLSRFPNGHKIMVCTLQRQASEAIRGQLDEAQVPILPAGSDTASVIERSEAVLHWADKFQIRNICFWNASPEIKVTVAKVLTARQTRLIDVSPGPMLFDELEESQPFQRRVSSTTKSYFDRLDFFVAKYADGIPPASLCASRGKIRVIPNGVPLPPRFVPLPPPPQLLPSGLDPALAVGTCGRIVPDKCIEFLLDSMRILSLRSPGASLTIVGGPDSRSVGYLGDLIESTRRHNLAKVFFVGEHDNVMPFLGQFGVFVVASERQGCPNAVLEAMVMGLPIVARRSGGTAELVSDGVNGFLVTNPAEMAEKIALLQRDKRLRRKFGRASYAIASTNFSIGKMRDSYVELLNGPPA